MLRLRCVHRTDMTSYFTEKCLVNNLIACWILMPFGKQCNHKKAWHINACGENFYSLAVDRPKNGILFYEKNARIPVGLVLQIGKSYYVKYLLYTESDSFCERIFANHNLCNGNFCQALYRCAICMNVCVFLIYEKNVLWLNKFNIY